MVSPCFASTRWSKVIVAGSGDSAARTALAWLCTTYWDPLRAHVLRRGFQAADADDLTQDFLLSIVQGGVIERADRERGRFRTFLLACLDHHLGRARERMGAQKRGGRVGHERVEPAAPAGDVTAGFDRDWAEVVLARTRHRLVAEAADPARTQALMPFLARNGDSASYAAAGARCNLESGAVRVAVHRLRQGFTAALRSEIANTLAEPTTASIDAEITDLLAALAADFR